MENRMRRLLGLYRSQHTRYSGLAKKTRGDNFYEGVAAGYDESAELLADELERAACPDEPDMDALLNLAGAGYEPPK